ncbi:hypothetical protein ATZ36_03405, partial [Candidatus Endomicrobiellum trichonymphae]
ENIGTAEGLAKNFGRGFTCSLSRDAEDNSIALDKWNEKNPVKSIIADVAGSIPSMLIPGGLIGVGAKVLSKAKTFVKLAKVAAKLKIANKLKTAANVFSKPTVKAATAGGAYSGFRSFVDRQGRRPRQHNKERAWKHRNRQFRRGGTWLFRAEGKQPA